MEMGLDQVDPGLELGWVAVGYIMRYADLECILIDLY